MTNQNLIHIKLNIEEELEGKKDILTIQADLLELKKNIIKYNSLRTDELKIKLKLYTKIKKLKNMLHKLQTTLPKIKINELPQHENKQTPNSSQLRSQIKVKQNQSGLDRELEEIQKKLKELSA